MASTTKIRDAMLFTAIRLFRERGYSGTSMLDVVRESGAPRGSLYHYFPGGKQQMGEEAVTLAGTFVRAWIREADKASDTASDLFRRLGEAYSRALEESEFREGCPVATVALETAASLPELAKASDKAFNSWTTEVEQALVGKGVGHDRARELALLGISAIEGSLLLARVAQSGEPVRKVAEQLAALTET